MHPTSVKIEKQEDSPLDVFALVSRHGLANERMTSVASVVLVWSFFVTIVTDTRVAEGSEVERLGLDALGELQSNSWLTCAGATPCSHAPRCVCPPSTPSEWTGCRMI